MQLRDRLSQTQKPSRNCKSKSKKRKKKLQPKRLPKMRRPKSSDLRKFYPMQARLKSWKKKIRRQSLKSSKSVKLLISNRPTSSLKKAQKVRQSKKGFAVTVKISRQTDLLSKHSRTPSTKIRARLTFLKLVLTERKKRGKWDFMMSSWSRKTCSKKLLKRSLTRRNLWCFARWRTWRKHTVTTSMF